MWRRRLRGWSRYGPRCPPLSIITPLPVPPNLLGLPRGCSLGLTQGLSIRLQKGHCGSRLVVQRYSQGPVRPQHLLISSNYERRMNQSDKSFLCPIGTIESWRIGNKGGTLAQGTRCNDQNLHSLWKGMKGCVNLLRGPINPYPPHWGLHWEEYLGRSRGSREGKTTGPRIDLDVVTAESMQWTAAGWPARNM